MTTVESYHSNKLVLMNDGTSEKIYEYFVSSVSRIVYVSQ